MKFLADVQIMPHPEIMEPQGNTIQGHAKFLQLTGIEKVRVGKFVQLLVEAESEGEAHQKVEKICQRLLANPVTESFSFHLREAPPNDHHPEAPSIPTAHEEE